MANTWNDAESTARHSWVCEMATSLNYGWKNVEGIEIFIGFAKLSISEAKQYCSENDGRLYEPRNITQAEAIHEQAKKLGFDTFWLGITVVSFSTNR